ncbi:MAG: DUF2191 domain-containing protein [Frankiaceae bacterium]
MTKRLVDIEDELVAAARAELGTRTLKETVHEALTLTLTVAARRREIERLTAGEPKDLRDPDVTASAWR